MDSTTLPLKSNVFISNVFLLSYCKRVKHSLSERVNCPLFLQSGHSYHSFQTEQAYISIHIKELTLKRVVYE